MHAIPFKPHRCARGGTNLSGVAAKFTQISLYNNSVDGSWLAVRAMNGYAPGGDVLGSYVQGTVGTLVGPGVPIMTGIGVLAGQIFSAATATTFGSYDYVLQGSNTAQATTEFPVTFVYGLIGPGQSLVATADVAAIEMVWSFFWQVLRGYEIDCFDKQPTRDW